MRVQIPANPKRKLGQNFLHDENVIAKILDFIKPSESDYFLEIGGGTGALTAPLAPLVKKLFVVEFDAQLVSYLENIPSITILQKDIRKVPICDLEEGVKLRIVGNLPYYISTSILTTLLKQLPCIHDMNLMFQEEVAQRILASPSHHEYGMLSVFAQYYCEIEKGFRISKNSFIPKPEIESRLLRFTLHRRDRLPYDQYTSFLIKAFSQRRKKLRNNLIRGLDIPPKRIDSVFDDLGISSEARAENLTADQYEQLIVKLRQI